MSRIMNIITVGLNPAIDRVLEVPDFAVGEHLAGRRLSRFPAGKAINVSRALARLGRGSIVTGFVGQTEFDAFENVLADTGPGRIVCQLLAVRGRTRENITVVDPKRHTDTHIRERGFEVSETDLKRMRSKISLLVRQDTLVLFSGSLPPGMTDGDFAALVGAARRGGARVVLDLDGPLLGQLCRLDEPAPDEPMFWLLKPNRKELAALFHESGDLDEQQTLALAQRLAQVSRWVVVTLGGQGAWLVGREASWRGRLPLEDGQVVNTVGCGDCMMAGLLDAQAQDLNPPTVLTRGLAAAAANAQTPGIADFDAAVVVQLRQRATVEPAPADA